MAERFDQLLAGETAPPARASCGRTAGLTAGLDVQGGDDPPAHPDVDLPRRIGALGPQDPFNPVDDLGTDSHGGSSTGLLLRVGPP